MEENKNIIELEKTRERITELDDQITQLFIQRMRLAKDVAEYKAAKGKPVLDPEKEKQKLIAIADKMPEEFKDYAVNLYECIFEQSRDYQNRLIIKWKSENLKCGLLGEKLGHSYSPQIHAKLADYEYKLYEVAPENLADFIRNGKWDGLNVTIPYKKSVLPLCDELSVNAEKIGSVNTLVKRPDGTIYGDNTDAYGFQRLMDKNGVDPKGKKTLILGNGGACAAVKAVLENAGAEVIVISRKGENNYENLHLHKDAKVIVNTTPVGMYPNNGKSPVDLKLFPECEAVLDIVYNPARTAITLQAEELGLINDTGLYMLVAQALRSSEQFASIELPLERIDEIQKMLAFGMQNVVIVGMPGSGKSAVSSELGRITGREVAELDAIFAETYGMTPAECITNCGEEEFRRKETEVVREIGKKSGLIISTGGGVVTRPENYNLLHQNGTIVWIKRDIDLLPVDGRPISQQNSISELYEKRKDLYKQFADIIIDNNCAVEETAEKIIEVIK